MTMVITFRVQTVGMPGLVPGIRVFEASWQDRRGWPRIGERKRRRSSNGYGPAMTA
jgi:hypothetical protein